MIIDYCYKGSFSAPMLEHKGVILWVNKDWRAIEAAPLGTDGKLVSKIHAISFDCIIELDTLTQLASLDRDLVSEWLAGRNK